jgi:hypothetical protein
MNLTLQVTLAVTFHTCMQKVSFSGINVPSFVLSSVRRGLPQFTQINTTKLRYCFFHPRHRVVFDNITNWYVLQTAINTAVYDVAVRALEYMSTCFDTHFVHLHANIVLTYLLTPWSRVLEKLTGSAASQDISRIFGTRRFLTVLTTVRHISLP